MIRLMIYAQVPPPLHGQSIMARYLVDGLRKAGELDLASDTAPSSDPSLKIAFMHVNPQISADFGDIGRWGPRKLLRVFGFTFKAIGARFRHDLDTFYFVPAPPKRAAIWRDLCVLFFCRLFYQRLVLHWHCIGQPEFIENNLTAPEKWMARLLYGGAALSIALSNYSGREAAYFRPQRSVVVPNGIPDPCPDFDVKAWPHRQSRAVARAPYYEVMFLAGRMTEKGLFDAMAAVTKANEILAEKNGTRRFRLTVAGPFEGEEQAHYESAALELNATQIAGKSEPLTAYKGWVDEAAKRQLFRDADCFIFPTTYPAESFGLVLAEAMAHGCAVITTRWQAVPEVLPAGYDHLVEPRDIDAMAASLLRCMDAPADRTLRDYFLARFTLDRFVKEMITALGELPYNNA
jgi:glycosyltransferase involved in cell wall biosynthesis